MTKATLRKVRLKNGRDSIGAYWGKGTMLFWYAFNDETGKEISDHIRAGSRDNAKEQIRALHPTFSLYF